MRAAISKAEIESAISSRFSTAFKVHEKCPAEVTPTGIPQIDGFKGGLPRGAITEIFGAASSGRTTFLLSSLAHATTHEEVCALVDTNDVFDPTTASRAGIHLDRLLWVRCNNNLEHAFKTTDMLLQAGGFGIVTLDLGDVPAKSAKRIISSWWYRFRRTLESTSTALVVIVEESAVRSCATVALELKTENYLWSSRGEKPGPAMSEFPSANKFSNRRRLSSGARVASISTPSVIQLRRRDNRVSHPHANLLRGLSFQVDCRRPLYLKREVSCKANC